MIRSIVIGRATAKIVTAIAVLVAGNSLHAAEAVRWSYSGATGPEHWAELAPEYAACEIGVNQSPVDITETIASELDPLDFDYGSGSTIVVNNGHTLQVNARPGSWLRVEGEDLQLQQMHVHSPSEHQINGELFLLEAHFVHQNEDGQLAVVAVLFRAGEWNADLAEIGKVAPLKIGGNAPVDVDFGKVELHAKHDAYFRYNGSLTTPSSTEGVRWYVLKSVGTLSPDQAARFVELISEDARGPQPLSARIIMEH